MQKLVEEHLKKQSLTADLKGPFSVKISDVHTGTWRRERPVVDAEACIVCGICMEYCPCGVIEKKDGQICIDYTYCKGCGICREECPKKAIQMVLEKEAVNHGTD